MRVFLQVIFSQFHLKNANHRAAPSLHYRVFKEADDTVVPAIFKSGKDTAILSHTRQINFRKIDKNHLEYLTTGCVPILVFSDQEKVAVGAVSFLSHL